MNVQSLWAGSEYAWKEWRPKGVFPMDAKQVRLVKVTKRRVRGNDRLSSFAMVTMLDEKHPKFGKDAFEVRTRDIVDFWDSYEDERQHRKEEQERRETERRERLARESEERTIRMQKQATENEAIARAFEERGLPRSAIFSMDSQITLEREEVMEWLQIPRIQ